MCYRLHFNDILRNFPDRQVDIVVPEANTNYFVGRMEKVFGTAADQYSEVTVQNHPAKKAKKVRLIAAKADEINIAELFASR